MQVISLLHDGGRSGDRYLYKKSSPRVGAQRRNNQKVCGTDSRIFCSKNH
ncbi:MULTISPECIES: hypothetical protein [unclassified Microcoleus]